jgi:tRNA pseudouridine55 synthase
MNGLLILNKPAGVTSRFVVDCVAARVPRVRIGHAGTLDPLATGVLVLCLGSATRLIEYVQRMSKTYLATIQLGATSDTDDAEGVITEVASARPVSLDDLQTALRCFQGVIQQVPPAYSAARVDGRRAHDLARKGQSVELAPRPVRIDQIELLRYAYPQLEIRVECGKGTYIRSLARDLGQHLGCGGYITALQRTRIGPFHCSAAIPLEIAPDQFRSCLLPPHAALAELPSLELPEEQLRRLRHGQRLVLPRGTAQEDGEIVVRNAAGEPLAIAVWDSLRCELTPHKVLQR